MRLITFKHRNVDMPENTSSILKKKETSNGTRSTSHQHLLLWLFWIYMCTQTAISSCQSSNTKHRHWSYTQPVSLWSTRKLSSPWHTLNIFFQSLEERSMFEQRWPFCAVKPTGIKHTTDFALVENKCVSRTVGVKLRVTLGKCNSSQLSITSHFSVGI